MLNAETTVPMSSTRRGLLAQLGAGLGAALATALPGRPAAAAPVGCTDTYDPATGELYALHGATWLRASRVPAGRAAARMAEVFDRPEAIGPDESPGFGGRDVGLWKESKLIGYIRRRPADGQLESVVFED